MLPSFFLSIGVEVGGTVEVKDLLTEEESVLGLEGCGLGLEEGGLLLLVLGGCGFAVLVLSLHEVEGGA